MPDFMPSTFGQQFQQGWDQAQQRRDRSRLAALYQQAATAPQEQRGSLLAQMAGIDPQAATFQQSMFDRQQRTADDQRQRQQNELVQVARLLTSAPEAYRPQVYEQFRQKMGGSFYGNALPEQYGPDVAQAAEAILQAYGGTPGSAVQSTYVDANGNRVAIMRDGSTAILGQNAPQNQIIDTGAGFYGVNRGNLQAAPVMLGSRPSVPQAGVGAGGMPYRIDPSLPPEAQALAAADAANGGVSDAYTVQGAAPTQLRSAPKPQAPSDIERRLQLADQYGATPEEKRRMVVGGQSARDAQRISAKDATTARQKITQIRAARQQLAAVKAQFQKLRGTLSAGLGGNYLPTPEGQAFDRAVRNLAPLITAVTRVPGVGAMSDYESKLQEAALPSRGTYEAVTGQQIGDLERLLDTVEGGYNDLLGGGSAPPTAADEADDSDEALIGKYL